VRRITKIAFAVLTISGIGITAGAGAANAATVNPNGSVSVTKGEVQSVLKINNAAFDTAVKGGTLHFTGIGEVSNHTRVTFGVGDQSWSYETAVDYKAGDATANPVWNAGNHTQVTGFTVTGAQPGAFDKVEYPVAGSMLPSEAFGDAVSAANAAGTTWTTQVDSWTVSNIDGVAVNGVALPIT
jgi:hypothetical protein